MLGGGSCKSANPHLCKASASCGHRSRTFEAKLGDVSPEKVQAVEAHITRAREVDSVGDQSACEQALAEVRRVLNY